MCDYVRARHHRSPSRSEVRRPGLHPPLPAVRINNNLLVWSSVSYPSRDRVDPFSSTLRRRRNMGELDRRSGIGFMRLETVQRNAENPQQRSLQENWDQLSQLHVPPIIDCRMREGEALCRVLRPKSYRTEPRCAPSTRSDHWHDHSCTDDNALSSELIRELLEGSGQ